MWSYEWDLHCACLKCYSGLVGCEFDHILNNPAPAAMSTYPEGSLPHSALRWQVNEFPSVGSFRVPSLCFWVFPKKGRLVEESMSFESGTVNCRLLALGLNNSVGAFRWGYKRGALYPRELITVIKKSFRNVL